MLARARILRNLCSDQLISGFIFGLRMGFSHFLGTASLSNNVILGIKHVNWHMLYVLLLQAEIERLRLRLHTFKRESNLCIFNLACCGIYLTDLGVNCPVWEMSADVPFESWSIHTIAKKLVVAELLR